MMKKTMAGAGIAAAVALLTAVLIAGAQTTTPPTTPTQPRVLQVGREGRVLMRGTIASVASSSLTVNSWGGTWIVNLGANTEVLPAGTDVVEYKDGDFVGVQGTVSQSANWTIDATLVRDWTYRQAVNQERQQNVQSARETMRSGPRDYVGVVSSAPTQTAVGWSWMLTIDGIAYTVNAAANAQVVNRNWLTIQLSAIQNGDNVRVWGVNASGTIAAQIVRDVSLPATSTTAH